MNSSRDLILAIDQGTQSTRAMLFSTDGKLVAKSQRHIDPYFSSQPNWAEQHAQYFWDNVCAACLNLWAEHPALRERVTAASITCQRATMVCLDEHMEPLRPATVWLDSRRTNDYPELPIWQRMAIGVACQRQMVHQLQSKAECNWLATDFPDIWASTRYFVQLSSYLTLQLTGSLCDAVASQVGYMPFDYRRQRWAVAGDLKWMALRVRPQQLPLLVRSGGLLGNITAEASRKTGIPTGLRLYASGADKACEVLAAGAISPDVACLSYGTTATINTGNTRYVEPMFMVPAYPAAKPDAYNSEISVYRGYWMVNWFKREFATQEVIRAQEQGVAAELLFDDMLRSSPVGAQGLMLQPFWTPGIKFPGPEAKGAIIGFGDVHTRAHMYRAIIEGIAYALRSGRERLERRNRQRITRLVVVGGGSQSDEIMQITANIFGMPAERPHTYEASGLGAAMNAAVGAGYYPDHDSAVVGMRHSGAIFEPEYSHAKLYDDLYRRVYSRMYAQLVPLYRAIRHITHYPKL